MEATHRLLLLFQEHGAKATFTDLLVKLDRPRCHEVLTGDCYSSLPGRSLLEKRWLVARLQQHFHGRDETSLRIQKTYRYLGLESSVRNSVV